MEPIIELNSLEKSYDKNNPVVFDFNLTVNRGEFVTLLGPSGCGKTTTLRMIGGFEQPTSGRILLDGKDISHLPPNKRQINTVFQRYALFPHLNIYDNIAFGLREKKMDEKLIREKVSHVLRVVDLEGFEKRSVRSLSGGQQQRIAIARAIVNEPEILLLDEPLGALDYKMRQEMQLELKRMHKELGITFIFVTHDQEEAMTMSDKIVVMSKGMIQQIGTPEDIYLRPENAFVADFIGESNIFDGVKRPGGTVEFAGRRFKCIDDIPAGTLVDVLIRPEHVQLTSPESGMITGEVISNIFKGDYNEVTVLCGKNEIVARKALRFKEGETVGVVFPPEYIHNMPSDIMVNHFTGTLDSKLQVQLEDGPVSIDIKKLFPEYTLEGETLLDANGEPVSVEGQAVELFFSPRKAQLSDDPDEGIFRGNITDIIYKGDHYNYTVVSENEVEYSADDEDLWNLGDFVSISVPLSAIGCRLSKDSEENEE